MATENAVSHDIPWQQLPGLHECLPEANRLVNELLPLRETWQFVQRIYAELQGTNSHEYHRRNRFRRFVAPSLLLGLALIRRLAWEEVERLAALLPEDTEPASDDTIMGYCVIAKLVIDRLDRWTRDTRRKQLKRQDENNNHSVLALIGYQDRPQFWVATLASRSARLNLEAMLNCVRHPGKSLPMASFRSCHGPMENWMILDMLFTALLRYVRVNPQAENALDLGMGDQLINLKSRLVTIKTARLEDPTNTVDRAQVKSYVEAM